MRHLVYLLLLANFAYLGWNLFQVRTGSEQVRELPPLPATAKRLVTLQELQQQGQQKVQEQERQIQQEQLEQQEQQQAQTQVLAEEEQLHMLQQETVLEAPGAREDQVDPEELTKEDLVAIEAVTEAEPPGAGVSMLCQSLGPFLATEQLEQVAERLAELGLESSRRSAETRLENGWWVYLPAMPRTEARKIVQVLEDNNDREYFVGKGNYIALGTFTELSRAERRMQKVRRLGLEPILETRYRTQTTHWIDLRVTGALDGDLEWMTKDYPELQLESQSCR